uniref:Uncharacterized protein n=1 Tax=Rhizophora mucronata TaxID=61149 RepID=A0A2P2K434_RHIMU
MPFLVLFHCPITYASPKRGRRKSKSPEVNSQETYLNIDAHIICILYEV